MEMGVGVKTAFAEPGLQIDTQALRDIYAGLRELIDGLGEDFDAALEEARFLVELPEKFATPFANALVATDVAWRIGCMAGEAEDWRLPEGPGDRDLNEILPIGEFGLELIAVEDGSIKGTVERLSKKVTYSGVIATIALMQQFTGVTIHSNPHEPAAYGQGTPISIPSSVHGKVGTATSGLPTLPAGTKVIAEVKMADGTNVVITGPDTAQ